jgi:hypothetical protein
MTAKAAANIAHNFMSFIDRPFIFLVKDSKVTFPQCRILFGDTMMPLFRLRINKARPRDGLGLSRRLSPLCRRDGER